MKENNQQDQSNPAWVCLGSLYRLAIVDPLPEKSYEGSPQPPDMILRISNGYLEIMLTYNTVLVFWCILVILSPLIRLPTPTIAILWSIILAFPVGGCSRNTRIETELCIRHSHRTIRLPWRLCLNSNTFQSRNFWKPKTKGMWTETTAILIVPFLGGAAAWSRSEDKTSQRPDSQPVHEGSGFEHILCQSESMLHLSLHLTKNKINKVVQPQLLRQCHKFSTIYTTSIVDKLIMLFLALF